MQSDVKMDHLLERGNDLLVSISGVRGTIPVGLDPINTAHFARAFAVITGKRIVIGNDARPTGPALKQIFCGVLMACGKEVIDVGLAPTPTIKAAVNYFKAQAGVIVSASHNPLQWNGFKLIQPGGFFFDKGMGARLVAAMRDGSSDYKEFKGFGNLQYSNAIGLHVAEVLRAIPAKNKIRKMRYRVVVDAVAGAGREALPILLTELGCRVERLYCEPTSGGKFPRPPEPTPAALGAFGRTIKAKKAALGFALDPDADRLVTGSPGRGCVHEEYTLPLALLGLEKRLRKSQKKPAFVVNLSTANLLDHVVARLGGVVYRSAVGEANVVAMMRKKKALFGGEGNGGTIHAEIASFGRDPLIGAALILTAMAERKARNLDQLLDELPELFMQKDKFEIEDRDAIGATLERIQGNFTYKRVDRRDGLYLNLENNAWLHVRASNTEPVLRSIAQAADKKSLFEIVNKMNEILG